MPKEERHLLGYYRMIVRKYKKMIIAVFVLTVTVTPVVSWKMLGYSTSCLLNIGAVDKAPIFDIFQLRNVVSRSDEFKKEILDESKKLLDKDPDGNVKFKFDTIRNFEDRQFPLIVLSVTGNRKAYTEAAAEILANKILARAEKKYDSAKKSLLLKLKQELAKTEGENVSIEFKSRELLANLKILEKSKESLEAEKASIDAKKKVFSNDLKLIPLKKASILADKKVAFEGKNILDARERLLDIGKDTLRKGTQHLEAEERVLESENKAFISLGRSLDKQLLVLEKNRESITKSLANIRRDIKEIEESKNMLSTPNAQSLYSLIKSYIWSSSLNMGNKSGLRKTEILLLEQLKNNEINMIETRQRKKKLQEEKMRIAADKAELRLKISQQEKEMAALEEKLHELTKQKLEHDKDILDFRQKPILLDKEKFKIEKDIAEFGKSYIAAEEKFLQYEGKIAIILKEQADIEQQARVNRLAIEELKEDIEKLEKDGFSGRYKGIEKPKKIESWKFARRPISKIVINTVIASVAALLISIFFAVFKNEGARS